MTVKYQPHKLSFHLSVLVHVLFKIFVMEMYLYYVYNIVAPKQHSIVVIYNAPNILNDMWL